MFIAISRSSSLAENYLRFNERILRKAKEDENETKSTMAARSSGVLVQIA